MYPETPNNTHIHMLEGQLEDREQYYRQIIQSLPGAFYICNAEGFITYFNKKVADLWGREPELGKDKWFGSWRIFRPNGDPLPFEASPMAITLKEGRSIPGEEIIVERPDGIRYNLLTQPQPIFNAKGKVIGAYNILVDITERKTIDDDLIEKSKSWEILNQIGKTISSQLDLDKVVQAITDAATEISGAQFGAFFYNVLNDKGESYTLYTISGVPKEAFSKFPMPRNTAIFSPTFHGEGIVRSDDITKDPRYGKNSPYFGMPKGHLPVTSYLAVPVISRTGEVIGGLFFGHSKPGIFTLKSENLVAAIASQAAIAMDNSKLYEASKMDKQKLAIINTELNEKNEELKRTNVDLDNFIYTASHDLKAPVSNIEGLLSTLSDILNEGTSSKEEINSILNMMSISANRFSKTIKDLTTITKIQKDFEEEMAEKVNIPDLIEDIKLANSSLIASAGASIILDCENCMEITFSRKNMKSILHNLISNAIKYKSSLRPPEVHISIEKADGYIILKVKDNGLGLDADKQKKLFSMFKRFHDHVEGTGIGLYLVKRIITNAGGKVEVESQPDIGSTFKVYFKDQI
jgi:PAS domain S-box-containing protein